MRFIRKALERRSIRAAFRRYLDPREVAALAANPDRVLLQCNTAWLSCLFIQVHDDTPEEIQQHVAKVIPICMEHKGTVFSVLASVWLVAFGKMFKFDNRSPDEARRDSRAAASQMLEVLGQNVKLLSFEGEMTYGNVGSEKRFNFTVVIPKSEKYLKALVEAGFGKITEFTPP